MLPDTDDEQQIEAWLATQGDKTRLTVENRGLPLAELLSTAPAGRPISKTSPALSPETSRPGVSAGRN